MKDYHGSCSSDNCCKGSRHFHTKDEKVDMLKEYKKTLDDESKGVAEHIKELEQ